MSDFLGFSTAATSSVFSQDYCCEDIEQQLRRFMLNMDWVCFQMFVCILVFLCLFASFPMSDPGHILISDWQVLK